MHESNTKRMRPPVATDDDATTVAYDYAATIAVPNGDALTEILRGGAQCACSATLDPCFAVGIEVPNCVGFNEL